MGTLAAALKYSGTIFLAFGITMAVIELLGAKYGAARNSGVFLATVLLVAGTVFVLGGRFLRRGRDGASSTR
jgi:hypothetical protein